MRPKVRISTGGSLFFVEALSTLAKQLFLFQICMFGLLLRRSQQIALM
jgi:hypothetical protein